MTKEEFIAKNRNVSPDTLRLKYHSAGLPWLEEAVTQIECERKGMKKFGNVLPEFLVSTLSIEQASAPALASFHASLVPPGSKVLDMTMGLGIDASFIARVPDVKITSCEINPMLAEAARKNYADISSLEIICGDSVKFLRQAQGSYNIIFIDPARRDSGGNRVYNLHDCTPDLPELLPVMQQKADIVIAKLSPMLDITRTISDLPGTQAIYAVDDGSECKEILAYVSLNNQPEDEPVIIVRSENLEFRFKLSEEKRTELKSAVPEIGKFIYEPSPAMMKAAPFHLLSQSTSGALARNTHLFISESDISDIFPGKIYRITDIFPLSAAKEIRRKYPELNLAVRNFPMSVTNLARKLKIKEGKGDTRAYAVTLADNSKVLIVAEVPKI